MGFGGCMRSFVSAMVLLVVLGLGTTTPEVANQLEKSWYEGNDTIQFPYDSNEPKDRLGASLSIGAIAINNGANIIRVHDISKSIEAFSIIDRLLSK